MPGRKSNFTGQRAPGGRGRRSSAATAAAFLETYRKRSRRVRARAEALAAARVTGRIDGRLSDETRAAIARAMGSR